MNPRLTYTYDDCVLVPQYSNLDSRSEVDISSQMPWGELELPIISAPMDTVTEAEMIATMRLYGGDGVFHRYCSEDRLLVAAKFGFPVAVAPSMGTDFLLKLVEISPFPNKPLIKVDVAHADSRKALDYSEQAVRLGCNVISGNIVTPAAVVRYLNIGVDMMSIGIGPGSFCTTRQVAGVGYPQLSAIMDIRDEVDYAKYWLIADGGIKYSGDIVKALAAGADAVMIGGLFAGTDETPNGKYLMEESPGVARWVKDARGMASREALELNGKEVNPEGVSTYVECKGSVANILKELRAGIKAGFSYLGASSLQELRENCFFVGVTQNGLVEGSPRV